MWTLLLTLASAADLAPRADVESLSGLPAPTAWEASDGSLGTPEGRDLAEAVDGGRFWLGVLGESGHETAWLTRLDARGAPAWSRRYDTAGALSPWQVVGAVDGGAWVIGATPDARGDDVAVLRVDRSGEPVSLRRLGADVGGKEQIRHATRTSDGGLLLTGDLTRGDDVRGLVIRLDGAGEVVWSTILDADARARDALSAGLEVNGGVIVVGRSKGEGAYPSEAGWVAQLDGSGAVVRSELVIDLADDLRLSDVAVGPDGLVLAGASAGSKPLVVWLDGDAAAGVALDTTGRPVGLASDGSGLLWAASGARWTTVYDGAMGATTTLHGGARRWRAVGLAAAGLGTEGTLVLATAGESAAVGSYAVELSLAPATGDAVDARLRGVEERVDVTVASLPRVGR
jgi:hypothetical protein